mmetsp:Transcript_32409/g.80322  ORF Transcript_32409/g.80322 Transcript_32409/m.80322 type:complete len:255 (+) Transcript_32409:3263-4027(+)
MLVAPFAAEQATGHTRNSKYVGQRHCLFAVLDRHLLLAMDFTYGGHCDLHVANRCDRHAGTASNCNTWVAGMAVNDLIELIDRRYTVLAGTAVDNHVKWACTRVKLSIAISHESNVGFHVDITPTKEVREWVEQQGGNDNRCRAAKQTKNLTDPDGHSDKYGIRLSIRGAVIVVVIVAAVVWSLVDGRIRRRRTRVDVLCSDLSSTACLSKGQCLIGGVTTVNHSPKLTGRKRGPRHFLAAAMIVSGLNWSPVV